jgi:protein-disulfide isomerase
VKIYRRFLIFLALGAATVTAAQSPPKGLATINGEAITEEQVSKAAEADLQKLELRRLQFEAGQTRDKQDALERALNALIEDKLLALEASKRKITKEQLEKAELEDKVAVPTEEEVAQFYEQNKARIQAPREDVLPQIGPFLLDQRRQEARAAFIAGLKKQYDVTSYLEPLRAQLATDGFPTRGPAAAPVTIVEFSDFECPFCGNLFPVLKEIETNYAGKVRVIYRQYPLDIHPHAQKAAEASLCANEQQSFWVFHDLLFGNQKDLTVEALKKKAEDLKLNTAAFNACLDSGKHAAAIRQDIVDGSKAGVSATPAMFINGRLLVGARPYADISSVIEDELQRKGVK